MSPKPKSLKRKKDHVPPSYKDEEVTSVFKDEVDVSDEDEEFIGNISNELNDSSDSEGSSDDTYSDICSMSEQLGISEDDDDEDEDEDEDDDEDNENNSSSYDEEEYIEEEEDLDSEYDTDQDDGENDVSDSDLLPVAEQSLNSTNDKDTVSKQKHANKKELKNSKEKPIVKKEVSKTKTQNQLKSTRKENTNNQSKTLQDIDATKEQEDEYQNDSSDEEDIRNTVGNIPMKWYDEYAHLGYDWDGKKILKPGGGTKTDNLDAFLSRMEDPDFWRTVKDPQTGQDVILSAEDIKLIHRIQAQQIPDESFEEYAPWIEWFTSKVMKEPVRNIQEHKRSFLPSKTEKDKVSKLVHALKMGWLQTKAEQDKRRAAKKEKKFYMLWSTDDKAEEMRRIHNHISAPKRLLPGHAESYNPPPEFLFDKKELKEWNKQKDTPWKRKLHFIPAKYESLRHVPSYSRFIKERFLRCLDLYLCPRAIKMRLTIEPEELVPQLPSPKDLQPFPTTESYVYKGHTDMIRCMTIDNMGQYLATGSDDMTVKVWEVSTGRCVKTIECGGTIRGIAWCPNNALALIAVAADRKLLLVNPGVSDNLVVRKTDELLQEALEMDVIVNERVKTAVQWEKPSEEEWSRGIRMIINHFKEIKQVSWHGRGDYFSTVMPDGQNRSVLIHQLSRRSSQLPFTKSKGLVQCVLFHPIRPFLFVATQRNVRVYDLVKQELVKKLLTNSRWISCMAVHPGGDNLLVGTYDRKMLWFDLDLSTKPYQTIRLHGTAVRGVAFHKRYPLFASGSDDKSLIISHGMVYNDLLQNPLIVPVKRLQNHTSFNDFGILDVIFHPLQPWVFSAGADGTVRLYT